MKDKNLSLSRQSILDIVILTSIALLYFIVLKLRQFYMFGNVTELTFYEILFYNTLQGNIMWENPTGLNYFAQHFSPILFLFIPVYYLFQSPLTLLVIHAIGAAAAIIPLYLLSIRITESRIFSISICLAYFFSRTVNYALMFDFHQEIFYPVFFLSLFYAFIKKNWLMFYIFLLLCISVKEDANIALMGIGIYLMFRKQYLHGAVTFCISLAALIVTFKFIIPSFRPPGDDYRFVSYWADFGSTSWEVLINMLNPLRSIPVLFTPDKLSNMFNMFSVYLFLPLVSPVELIFIVLPSWFILFSSRNSVVYSMLIYYGMLITPMLLYTTIISLRRIGAKHRKAVLIISILLVLVNLGNSRIFKQLFEDAWKIPPRFDTAIEMINKIPPGVPVSAQLNLAARIPARDIRDVIPNALDKAEYIMFDLKGNPFPLDAAANHRLADSLKSTGNWNIVSEKDDFVLMKRK